MWILNVPDIDQISGWYSAMNIGQIVTNSCRDEPKKTRLIYHPGLILAINVIYITLVAINFYMNSTNELVAYALFDMDYFLGLNHRVKFTQLIAMTTVLFSQCVYLVKLRQKTRFFALRHRKFVYPPPRNFFEKSSLIHSEVDRPCTSLPLP